MASKKAAGLVAGLVLVLSACSTTVSPLNGSSTTSSEELTTTSLRGEPDDASTDPTVTAAPDTTTTTTEPPKAFEVTPNAFFRAGSKDWNNLFIIPGPVVEQDDVFYMFYTGHKSEGAGVDRGSVGYITSPDGTDWSFGDEEPLFDGAGSDWTAQALYASSAHILEDGTWAVWLTADARPFASRGLAIGRATAPGPDGPWKLDPAPALVPAEGTWYENGVGHPSVVKVGDEWRMYFDGFVGDLDSEPDRAIDMASSSDGLTWTVAEEPVFRASADGWDMARVMAPSVVELDDGYVMTDMSTWRREGQGYLADFGYATSDDGLTWTRAEQGQLLENRGTIGFITSGFASPIGNEIFIYFDSAASITSPASSIIALVANVEDL
jgi:predicted GH43/DUF377 family glycosyl hydrolase